MKQNLSILFICIFMASLLSACGNSEHGIDYPDDTLNSPSEDIDIPESSELPKTYDGELTVKFYFGSRTGHYSGQINEAGVPDGHGTFVVENLTGETWTYKGDWIEGHWEGTGMTTWSSGQTYSGEYTHDEETGYGVLILATGEQYEGMFVALSIVGEGALYYTNGASFKGTFTDLDNAIGTYYDSEGFVYNATIEKGELKLRPVNDFFSDEDRQAHYNELYQSYQYSALIEYINKYLSENEVTPLDSAYSILDLLGSAVEYEGQWNVTFDSFDSKYILTFVGADRISNNISVAVSVEDTWLEVLVGFRKSGWLFFDNVALSIDGQQVYSKSIKSYDTTKNVISGNTIEEYCSCSFNDSVLEQLADAETAILRFSNNDSKQIYDHTLTQNEIDALYCGLLLSNNNRELGNLLYRYNNFTIV